MAAMSLFCVQAKAVKKETATSALHIFLITKLSPSGSLPGLLLDSADGLFGTIYREIRSPLPQILHNPPGRFKADPAAMGSSGDSSGRGAARRPQEPQQGRDHQNQHRERKQRRGEWPGKEDRGISLRDRHARRSCCSAIGPKIMPMMAGATGNSNRRMKKPTTPMRYIRPHVKDRVVQAVCAQRGED